VSDKHFEYKTQDSG